MRTTQRIARTACALALATLGTATVSAQTPQRNGGSQEGIRVRGQWTIEIRNPDGTVVAHREFENALDPVGGAQAITLLLTGQRSPGEWIVYIGRVTPQQRHPCPSNITFGNNCVIAEVDSPNHPGAPFKTLVVTIPESGPNTGKIVLAGHATAEADGDIARVGTSIGLCSSTVAPVSCTAFHSMGLTAHDVQPVQTVAAGQIIQVTVAISFVSANPS